MGAGPGAGGAGAGWWRRRASSVCPPPSIRSTKAGSSSRNGRATGLTCRPATTVRPTAVALLSTPLGLGVRVSYGGVGAVGQASDAEPLPGDHRVALLGLLKRVARLKECQGRMSEVKDEVPPSATQQPGATRSPGRVCQEVAHYPRVMPAGLQGKALS